MKRQHGGYGSLLCVVWTLVTVWKLTCT